VDLAKRHVITGNVVASQLHSKMSERLRNMKIELTPAQNSRAYRRALSARKFELLADLRAALEGLVIKESEEDMAAAYHDQFVTERVANLDYSELKLVDAALDRIDAGTFGKCQECGCLIAARRLHAIPWAVHCLACEERSTPAAGAFAGHPEEVFV
jgi:RNA polymerase-binding transcription factor DksA